MPVVTKLFFQVYLPANYVAHKKVIATLWCSIFYNEFYGILGPRCSLEKNGVGGDTPYSCIFRKYSKTYSIHT